MIARIEGGGTADGAAISICKWPVRATVIAPPLGTRPSWLLFERLLKSGRRDGRGPRDLPAASGRNGYSRSCTSQNDLANRAKAPGSQDLEDAVEDTSVVHPRNATRLVRQHGLETQRSRPGPRFGAYKQKRTSTCRQDPLNSVENNPFQTYRSVRGTVTV